MVGYLPLKHNPDTTYAYILSRKSQCFCIFVLFFSLFLKHYKPISLVCAKQQFHWFVSSAVTSCSQYDSTSYLMTNPIAVIWTYIKRADEGPEKCSFFTIKIEILSSPKPKKQKDRIWLSALSEYVATLIVNNILSKDREHSMQFMLLEWQIQRYWKWKNRLRKWIMVKRIFWRCFPLGNRKWFTLSTT